MTTHQFLRSSLGSAFALAASCSRLDRVGAVAEADRSYSSFNLGQEVDHDEQ